MAQIFSESFETNGEGSRYTLTAAGAAILSFTDGASDYAVRTGGGLGNIAASHVYNSPDGSFFFAVQDTDGDFPGRTSVELNFNDIDIAGFSNLSFSGLFAEDTAADLAEDWDADALVFVEVSIDGGAFTKIFQIASGGATNTAPSVDTDFNGIGDGAAITDAFQAFGGAFAGTGALLDLRVTFLNLEAGDEDIAIDNIVVSGDAAATTTVSIDSVSLAEGDAGTSILTFTVTRSDNTGAFTVDFASADGSATAGADYAAASGQLSFLAGGALTETISITINGDLDVEADETFTVALSNLVSTSGSATLVVETGAGTILNDDAAPPAAIVINEIDSDTPGTDAAEFVELFDGGAGNTSLDGYVLVFFNGNAASDASYAAFDLDGFVTDANGYFVAGNAGVAGVDLVFAGNLLQNGADAVALYQGNAADFPNGTAPTTANLVDAIVYDTADPDDAALLAALGETVQFDEAGAGPSDANALARLPNGSGDFVAQAPTPGASNDPLPGLTVDIAADAFSENGGSSLVTVTRGGATAGDLVVMLASSDPTEASAPLSVTILDGEASATFTLTGVDDGDIDGAQIVTVTASAAGFSDGSDSVTVTDDDFTPTITRIHEIQGSAFFSPILALDGVATYNTLSITTVTIDAVVTAIDDSGALQGFFVSDAIGDWDNNPLTSEGIFVMTRNDANAGQTVTSAAPGLEIGERVQVTAQVIEYQSFDNLPRTFLTNATIVQSGVIELLPVLVLDGAPGRAIPNGVLSDDNPDFFDAFDDAGDTFDPENDALDFYETIEGQLVTFPSAVVADGFVSGSDAEVRFKAYSLTHADADQLNGRGGYTIFGDPALSAPDTAATDDDVIRGGRHNTDGDVNPDILELDFSNAGIGGTAGFHNLLDAGDALGDVTGVIDFDFSEAKLYVTQALDAGAVAGLGATSPTVETTTLGADPRALRVATFNVENLGGDDAQSRFDEIAQAIADNLAAPDIIIVEEIQDNNGAANDGTVDASVTFERLIAALNLATGKTYQWVDEAPTNNAEGGEPGGNIRVGFLYDTARVQLGDLPADATLAERRQYTDRIGDGVRTAGDLIEFTDADVAGEINTADWSGTRRSLLGEFTFNGNTVYIASNHFPSKGGSDDFYEIDQNIDLGNPTNADFAQRNEVSEDVYLTLNAIAVAKPDARIVSGGDFNEFYFYRALEVAAGTVDADGVARTSGVAFTNLTISELAVAERYTFHFDGRSQALDHILVDASLASVADYDIVHINTGFNGRTGAVNPSISDHDPTLARFDFRSFGERLAGAGAAELIDGFGGDDTISGGLDSDTLNGGDGDDRLDGGAGADAIDGGAGVDTATYAASSGPVNVSLAGTPGQGGDAAGDVLTAIEILIGSDFGDSLSGAGGNDTLFGAGANDTLVGGAGADSINGGDGFDIASYGNAGGAVRVALWNPSLNTGDAAGDIIQFTTEAIFGSRYADNLQGNDQANNLRGGDGGDLILGGFGNDTLVGGAAGDDLGGGAGFDVVSYVGGGAVRIALWNPVLHSGDAAGDNIRADVEAIEGSLFNDTLEGSAAANNLRGSNGSDRILGGGGNDTLSGDFGNDTLEGGFGDDSLIGGGASDTFVYAAGGGADVIADFLSGSSVIDTIRLTGLGPAFDSFAEVVGAATQNGANVVIAFGAGQSLTLQNTVLADLDVDDFIFA